MKYLVIGSAGQIGAPLVEFLEERGHEVFGFDVVSGLQFDLRKKNDLLYDVMGDADFVFFLACDVGGSRYLAKYQHTFDFIHNNVQILENVFEALYTLQKPFIYASSQMSNMTYSPYGLIKSLGELYTRQLNGLVVKFWNVYGPEKDLEKAHVITDFILKAKHTGVIDMLTDGTEIRQFLHAKDCSRCLESLSRKYDEIPRDQELHITNFEWNSILDVATEIVKCFPDTKIIPSSKKDMVQRDKRNEPDSFILKYWKPEISLAEGIKDMVKQCE